MTGALQIVRAVRATAENIAFLELELRNGSSYPIEAGGLRMRGKPAYGDLVYFSASNHWLIAPGGQVHLGVVLPRDPLNYIDFVTYIETNGTSHALGSRLVVGWFSSELKHGTVGADVEA